MTTEMTPTEAEATLKAEFEREDMRLRLQIARYAGVTLLVLLIFIAPMLSGVFDNGGWEIVVWVIVELPLLVVATVAWRSQRFRMPDGTIYEGWVLRSATGLAAALSLLMTWLRFG